MLYCLVRYLIEFLWRQKVRREGGDHFEELLNVVSMMQGRDDSLEVGEKVSPIVYQEHYKS